VAVTEYVPIAVTSLVAPDGPPPHKKVAPGVVEVAVSVTVVLEQVSGRGVFIPILGGVIF